MLTCQNAGPCTRMDLEIIYACIIGGLDPRVATRTEPSLIYVSLRVEMRLLQ